jgi:UPF0271 protein
MAQVDLNLDLGDLPGEPRELFALASLASVACADRAAMARAVSFAMTRGTQLAARPAYPASDAPLASAVADQCAALQAIARKLGYPVTRIKPHGALYEDAARDPAVAAAILDGAARGLGLAVDEICVIGPRRGALLDEAQRRAVSYAREDFADRTGSAPLTDPGACARQALALAQEGAIEVLTIDTRAAGAVAIAARVRDALAQAGLLRGFA